MQHVVGSVRGILRFEFMRGVLPWPLHTQIDSVRTYQDEHLPSPVQWPELQQLLRRIDRSTPLGARDYAVLLIAARIAITAITTRSSIKVKPRCQRVLQLFGRASIVLSRFMTLRSRFRIQH